MPQLFIVLVAAGAAVKAHVLFFDLIIAALFMMKLIYVTSSQEHICESVRITGILTAASQGI